MPPTNDQDQAPQQTQPAQVPAPKSAEEATAYAKQQIAANPQLSQAQQAAAVQQIQSAYTPNKSVKIMQETAEVVGTVGMLTGLVAMIKNLFKK